MMRLDDTTALPDGSRLRLRLPHAADRADVHAVLTRAGSPVSDLETARLLRFDPREHITLCATAWDGVRDVVVGVASARRGDREPRLVVGDETRAPGVTGILRDALLEHARRAA